MKILLCPFSDCLLVFSFLNNNVFFLILDMEVSNLTSLFFVTDIRIMACTLSFLVYGEQEETCYTSGLTA